MKLRESDYLVPKEPPYTDDPHWSSEWLATNGLGGYASGTVTGLNTRAHHGCLIAALPSPYGRTVMLNEVYEHVESSGGQVVPLNASKSLGDSTSAEAAFETTFVLELGIPLWTFKRSGLTIEKRIWLVHSQNTVLIDYRVAEGKCRLILRPAFNMRGHDAPVDAPLAEDYSLQIVGDKYEVRSPEDLPPLRLSVVGPGGEFAIGRRRIEKIDYQIEANRGYAAVGELWIPGSFSVDLRPGKSAALVASTESWDAIRALTPQEALEAEYSRKRRLLLIADPRTGGQLGQQLLLAADQFLITPSGRVEDATRARAAGDEIRTIIAGYHWFTDWGRDTMISLEGLTLCTGRHVEASYILRTFAHAIRDGLIPNLFPEGSRGGLYHTADATLWFFHALDRYLKTTGDEELLIGILPQLHDIISHHLKGTRFGIHVDPADGLLRQGQEGCQLTWMDAKVDDWVVTPRRGKAVEINALWYNAIRLMEAWCGDHNQEDHSREYSGLAEKIKRSFNARFWYPTEQYLYDVVDGENEEADASFRPNQLFAISLTHPVLEPERWETVLSKVQQKLLTPVGLRSLAPGSKDYKSRYYGDLRARDAAYHQGTVWAWLIGPFVDAWLKVHPKESAKAQSFLDGFSDALSQACIGSISEVFDAEAPYTPRGCVAQAWSVAEVLRSLVVTSRD